MLLYGRYAISHFYEFSTFCAYSLKETSKEAVGHINKAVRLKAEQKSLPISSNKKGAKFLTSNKPSDFSILRSLLCLSTAWGPNTTYFKTSFMYLVPDT